MTAEPTPASRELRGSHSAPAVAVVGCGWAGRRHAAAFAQRGATVRWAVDSVEARARSLADDHPGARPTRDCHDALGDPEVGAVAICLPHALHAAVAVAAAGAGKDVLCEKPLAVTLAEVDTIVEAADRAGVVLMVAESERFDPLYDVVADLLANGQVGRPALVRRQREADLAASLSRERRWFLDAQMAGGGMMMSGGIHDVGTLRRLFGEVESVFAAQAPQRFREMGGDDTSVAVLRFTDGPVAILTESFVNLRPETVDGELHTLEVDGEIGRLHLPGDRTVRVHRRPPGAVTPEQRTLRVPVADVFGREVDHFLHCVGTRATPLTDGRSHRASLAVVLAAYRSMTTGRAERPPP